jgi:hypothetical protein
LAADAAQRVRLSSSLLLWYLDSSIAFTAVSPLRAWVAARVTRSNLMAVAVSEQAFAWSGNLRWRAGCPALLKARPAG